MEALAERGTRYAEEPARILFVDDEPVVLRSLGRLVRRQGDWRADFATGGAEALRKLNERPYDVVVSDMHMTPMDGATFLREVQKRHPEVVRIVLSGYTDPALIWRVIPVAHRFIGKPFDGGELRASLTEAIDLRRSLSSPRLRALVGSGNELPSPPETYIRLTELLGRPDTGPSDVAALVERDVALSAQVVRVANSAYFGSRSKVQSVSHAVSYLGVATLKVLVLGYGIVQQFRPNDAVEGFDLDAFERRSWLASRIATALLDRPLEREHASLAAMLHDAGLLLLVQRDGRTMSELLETCRAAGVPLEELERVRLGVDHAIVGAYLLGLWGLPAPVVQAVARHHGSCPQATKDPMERSLRVTAVQAATHVAVQIASEQVEPHLGGRIDPGCLRVLQLEEERLEEIKRALN